MKKTLFFGLIAAALGFTACSSEDDAILGKDTQKKGMVLNATVEQPAETRATIDNSADDWQFAFAENDEIKVTNSAVASDTYYTFTNDGTDFKSTDAVTTATAANWFAYFPSNSIDLTGQDGTLAGVADLYALAGTTAAATTGASGLTIPMSAKVAILQIKNFQGAIDIQVKTSATDFVTGLTEKSGEAGFDVTTSTTATSLFTASSTGTYYVAVPAGVKMAVKDGAYAVKSTGASGLTAGKYYTLTIGEEPLTLTALEDNSTVKIPFSNFQYRTSDQDWADYTTDAVIEVDNGEYVQFRSKPGKSHTSIRKAFTMTGSFAASGNVMSLLPGNMESNAFRDLFKGCTGLKDASQLQLPATTLANYCYERMFNGCTSLTAAPALPATTLANYCYSSMFDGCTNLTAAPALPATALAYSCYIKMFNGCTSLQTAPELPATTLAEYCYQEMFNGCTSLQTAPALPATSLAIYCYSTMFKGCTSLTTAPDLPATTLAEYCYKSMFDGCTSLQTAPTISATTLAKRCCQYMFQGCTSLTAAPELKATTLVDNCYADMFYGCKKLSSIKVHFTSWTSDTSTWLHDGVGSEATGTKYFYCPSSLPDVRSTSKIPDGWIKTDI